MAKPSTVNNQQSENSFCGEYKSSEIIKIANVPDLQVHIMVLLLCELLERIFGCRNQNGSLPCLFGKRLQTPDSLCWAVVVIFIFIATLAEDIYSLRLHVRLGDRREVPLEDWVSLVLQLRC